MAYAAADGAKLYWEDGGSGDPLLLIQGLGFSSAMWYRILPALEAKYRVIRYDARGIGRSDVPEQQWDIATMAADAMAVLDAAGAETAHVFGISLGGIVAQEVALTYPDRVRSLILCSTHPAGTAAVWPDETVMEMLRNRTTLPREEAIRASIPVGYAETTDRDWIEEDVRLRLELPTTEAGYMGQLMAGLGYTLALSVVERTRELGLLRAVGMSRRQLRAMIRWESVTIALIGGVLGVIVGMQIGVTLSNAFPDMITSVTFPWGRLALFLVFAVLAGVGAAVLPARRASRLDVLAAVSHE